MIISLNDFQKLKDTKLKNKTIVATSGFFDPIHPGHISCIRQSKEFGDILVVIVNGDNQCITKKGKPFIPAKDRAYIVDSLKDVDYVIIYDHATKYDCCEALEAIKPNVFTKGGDRDTSKKVPEAEIVEKYGGVVKYNVGDPKVWSSSDFLKDWVTFSNTNNERN